MTVSDIDDRMSAINQGAPIVDDIQQKEHPMDQLFRPGGRQGEEVFSPVYVKDMRHWAAIIFCADTDKPEKYIDSLVGDLTARKKRQEKLKFLPFLNRLGASLNPPKTWKSVEVLPVSSQQGAGCAACVNEFARRWVQGISFGEINEVLNGPELRLKQLKVTMESFS
mmetsp:Transcript_19173/g.33289  ORF Transcript_19173/g.33289 Transcript_19173/m.33289 type:complete len:167 (-) Transcript_19173:100-600(-)